MARKDDYKNKGFIFRVEEWGDYLSTSSSEEVCAMLEACIYYFCEGIVTQFENKGEKIFFKSQMRNIDHDKAEWIASSVKGTYAAYCRICKENGETPIPRQKWEESERVRIEAEIAQRLMLTGDTIRKQMLSNDNGCNHRIEFNEIQFNRIEEKHTNTPAPKNADCLTFEEKREAALRKLGG